MNLGGYETQRLNLTTAVPESSTRNSQITCAYRVIEIVLDDQTPDAEVITL